VGGQTNQSPVGQKSAAALNAEPPGIQTMQIGDEWADMGKSVALAVPSVLSTSEMNFLLNPRHPDFRKIKISEPLEYRFDSRLLDR
jgi:RES domain-containing protein